MSCSYKTIISKKLKFRSCVHFTIMLSNKCAAHLGIFLWRTLGVVASEKLTLNDFPENPGFSSSQSMSLLNSRISLGSTLADLYKLLNKRGDFRSALLYNYWIPPPLVSILYMTQLIFGNIIRIYFLLF